MEMIDGMEVDLGRLPDELASLAPLIKRYGVGDDLERRRLLEASSRDELRDLAAAPADKWDAINAFLDEHMERPGAPEQDVAIVLSNFAQAAMEAEFEA